MVVIVANWRNTSKALNGTPQSKILGGKRMEAARLDTLISSYIAAWNESDPVARLDLLRTVWHEQGEYTDPLTHAPGRAALDDLIGGFLARNPGAYLELAGKIEHHHQHLRFFWKMRFANGRELHGMDYGQFSADGQLLKIVGFFQP
jgi:hypothetical protein